MHRWTPVWTSQVLAQDKVQLHHPHFLGLQLMCMRARMSRAKGFFALFPGQKSAKVTFRASARVPPHVSSSTLSAHQMAPGSSAVLGSHDQPTARSVSRRGTVSPRTTPNGSHRGKAGQEGASDTVLGAVPVLGQGHGGPGVVHRQLLVGVQYIDKLSMCSCDSVAGSAATVLFLCNAWSTVDTCSASAPGCFGRFANILYAKGNSDPVVYSRPALLCLRFFADWRSAHR